MDTGRARRRVAGPPAAARRVAFRPVAAPARHRLPTGRAEAAANRGTAGAAPAPAHLVLADLATATATTRATRGRAQPSRAPKQRHRTFPVTTSGATSSRPPEATGRRSGALIIRSR